jgi:hypothetical protein
MIAPQINPLFECVRSALCLSGQILEQATLDEPNHLAAPIFFFVQMKSTKNKVATKGLGS